MVSFGHWLHRAVNGGTQGEPGAAHALTWSDDNVTAVQQALESGR